MAPDEQPAPTRSIGADALQLHLDDLRDRARYARERYDLYKARAYGDRPTSPARLRELKRAAEQAQDRLAAARSEQRARGEAGRP